MRAAILLQLLGTFNIVNPYHSSPGLATEILRSCRQLYFEGLQILYGNRFKAYGPRSTTISQYSPSALFEPLRIHHGLIKRLDVEYRLNSTPGEWRRVTGHVQFILDHFENLAILTITLVQDRRPHRSDLVALLGKTTSPDTIKAFMKANYAAEFQVSQCVELNLAGRWASTRRNELLQDAVRLLKKSAA
ncbi:hypothetical protein EJ08DRAFT_732682 [Tothia fuscella]|uniref:Uncharacterized protein n=1 Tax=Tothia fuscella TaxID=1048955 RepID=A0A9P4U0B5_9PEZI|nr:hypothetical protein EJ08DRAFT_732682 [Tothia fuscella]